MMDAANVCLSFYESNMDAGRNGPYSFPTLQPFTLLISYNTMRKTVFRLSALALSTSLVLSSCGGADSAESHVTEGNTSTPASAATNNMNGGVGNGATSTDPEATNGQQGATTNNPSPGVGSDASGTSSSSVSGAGTNSSNGTGAAGGAGSATTNMEGIGGAGKGKAGSNPQ